MAAQHFVPPLSALHKGRNSPAHASKITLFLGAALVALLFSVLCEWRLQGLMEHGSPYDFLSWSWLRVGAVALFAFGAFGMGVLWVSRGGPVRLAKFFQAHHAYEAKRLAAVLGASAGVVLAGWLLGLLGATTQDNPGDWRYGFVASALGLAFLWLFAYRRLVERSASLGFLLLGIPLGVTFVALMPLEPNAVWDGQGHFNAANAMSYVEDAHFDEGDLLALSDIPYHLGGVEELRVWADMSLENMQDTAQEIERLQDAGAVEIEEGTSRHGGASWMSINAVGRIPLAVGLWAGRLLGFGNVGEYTCARLANLAMYLAVWYFGLRALKHSQLVFATIALTPVGIYVATNFSYDAWLFAWFGYGFCRYVALWQRPQELLNLSEALTVVIPFVLGCLIKAIYVPLMLVFLALPQSKFASKQDHPPKALWRWQWSLLVVIGALFLLSTFALPFFLKGGEGYSDTRINEHVNSAQQLAYVLANPFSYLLVLATTSLEFFGLPFLANATGMLEYLVMSSSELALGILYLALLLGVALLGRAPAPRRLRLAPLRLMGLAGILLAYGLFASALYVGFTPVGEGVVDGLQPRYLLPFFPLFFGCILWFPALAKRTTRRVYRGIARGIWMALFGYYLVFIVLHFVVFF